MGSEKKEIAVPGQVEAHYLSPFGCFRLTGSPKGLRSVSLVSTKPCPAGPIPRELKEAVRQLDEYFKQQREKFDLSLDFSGHTDFHQAVWRQLVKIPYGRTTSYLSIADKMGDPKAIRAVGKPTAITPSRLLCLATG